jgi:hypothetical protein
MEQDSPFVHVNDSIRKLAAEDGSGQTWDFVCECPEVSCHASVTLTLGEFDTRRAASPPVPVLAAEHHESRRPVTARRGGRG